VRRFSQLVTFYCTGSFVVPDFSVGMSQYFAVRNSPVCDALAAADNETARGGTRG